MYTLRDKSVFFPWTVQSGDIALIPNIGKFVTPAAPRGRDSGLGAVHDGPILPLMLHEFQKYFVFLVIKSA